MPIYPLFLGFSPETLATPIYLKSKLKFIRNSGKKKTQYFQEIFRPVPE
jgi:hypothetical protein